MLGGPPFGAFATCTSTRPLRVGLLRIPGAGRLRAGLLGSCPLRLLPGGPGLGGWFGIGLPPAGGLIGVGRRPGIGITGIAGLAGLAALTISATLTIIAAGARTGELEFG